MAKSKRAGSKKPAPRPQRTARPSTRARFVGRDASPVLDHYPPKSRASAEVRPVAMPAPTPPSSPRSGSPGTAETPSSPLITLDRPFDVDEFAALLGETSIRVTVPRESLPQVVQRVLEFMGFGIYVYTMSVRPAPAELLKSFVVELQRVDYSAEKGAWVPFVEKGTSPSPHDSSSRPP